MNDFVVHQVREPTIGAKFHCESVSWSEVFGLNLLDENSVLTAIKALKSKEVAPLSMLLHRTEEEVSRF